MPYVTVADCGRTTVMSTVVDGEVERYRAVAPINIASGSRRGAGASTVGGSVPRQAVARGDGISGSNAIVDNQM